MKNLVDIITEYKGISEMEAWFFTHKPNTKNVYNDFVKWYNQQLNKLSKGELNQVLKTAMRFVEEDDLQPIK